MERQLELLPLFSQFIRDSRKGKRLKCTGQKIKPQTIRNYEQVLKLLASFALEKGFEFKVRLLQRTGGKQLVSERNHWHTFYLRFCDYLYQDRVCYDNYVGLVMRILRTFFGYLRHERFLAIGDFYKKFYSPAEEIQIITLFPCQLKFLIMDKHFAESLSPRLRIMKDIFVFGCTVALRCSDLFDIKYKDIERVGYNVYLSVKSKKTGFVTKIKLPDYILDILGRFKQVNSGTALVVPRVSIERFNIHIKKIVELAGWSENCPKIRYQRGIAIEQFSIGNNEHYRFCDRISTHIMRRTAITTMVMLGMPESLVRKISGHSPNSREFYRYVNYAQGYMDREIDKVYKRLAPTARGLF